MGVMLDLTDVVALTTAICDVPSVSGRSALADTVWRPPCARTRTPRSCGTVEQWVVARTHLGRAAASSSPATSTPFPSRAPAPPGSPTASSWGGDGRHEGGVAVALHPAAALAEPAWDVTWVFYDQEEVDADLKWAGPHRTSSPGVARRRLPSRSSASPPPPPSRAAATARSVPRSAPTAGRRTPRRAWRGVNAIHAAAPILERLRTHVPAEVEVDSLVYREGLNAVGIRGGIASNMIPDECVVTVNYWFALPHGGGGRSPRARAVRGPRGRHHRWQGRARGPASTTRPWRTSSAPSPRTPGEGWDPARVTDVARFASPSGSPPSTSGPGDPSLAHADDERCPVSDIRACAAALRAWLER